MIKTTPFRLAAAIIACGGMVAVTAQNPQAGTTAFDILHFTFSAREMALAGASIALPGDHDGFGSNPAAPAFSDALHTSVGLRSVVMDVWGAMAALGIPIGRTGVWSLNLTNVSYGNVSEVIDENGPKNTGRTWRADAMSGSLSWARTVTNDLGVGLSVKGVYHYMGAGGDHYSADGFAFDGGVQYRLLNSRLCLGLVLRNLGKVRSGWSDAWDDMPLPTSLGAGVSYMPAAAPSLRVNLDVEKTRGEFLAFKPGLEIAVYKRLLFLRGGYAFSSADAEEAAKVLGGEPDPAYQKSNWNTLCLGVGIATQPGGNSLDVDAGIEFHTDMEPSFAVTVHVGR